MPTVPQTDLFGNPIETQYRLDLWVTAPAMGPLPEAAATLAVTKTITDELAKRLRCGKLDLKILVAKLPPAIEDIDGQTTIGGAV